MSDFRCFHKIRVSHPCPECERTRDDPIRWWERILFVLIVPIAWVWFKIVPSGNPNIK